MENPLSPGTAILILSVILIAIFNARYAFPARLLVGLRHYQLAGGLLSNQKTRSKRVTTKSKKKEEEDDSLGEAEALAVVPTTYREVWDLPYFNLFDGTICLAELAGLVTALSALYAWHTDSPPPNHALAVSGLCVLGSLVSLAKTEFLARTTSTGDKIMALGYGVGGGLAAWVIQGRAPLWAPVQQQSSAAALVGPVLAALARPGATPRSLGLAGLRLTLAGASGVAGALLLLPALRFAAAFRLQRSPPAWAGGNIPTNLVKKTRLGLQFLGPLAASMLWGSLRADILFDVTPSGARLIQGAALAAVGLLGLSNTRLLMQRYLDTGLLGWHVLKHPAPGGLTHRGLRLELVRAKLALVSGLAGRAAVQAAAPAALFLGLGLAQLNSGLNPRLVPGVDANRVLDAGLGFLAWWCGAAHFLFVASHMWVFDAPVA
ncbi:hypothetical protein ACKKBG_A33375 [Auxenochlorella protothecoides x Auxenochlorella symbiontica]